jgi:cytoskeletal protein RodZ
MQLSEILGNRSIKEMNEQTNISEESLEALLEGNFEVLQRAKALGFVSILEREYQVDLNSLKEEINHYFHEHQSMESITLNVPQIEEQRGRSPLFLVLVFGLIVFASWYFITQFNSEKMTGWIPSMQAKFSSLLGSSETNSTLPQNIVESTLVKP